MTVYQPRIVDRNLKIRRTVAQVRKKTRLDKAIIAERMMAFAADRINEAFPEFFQPTKSDQA